MYKSSDGGKYQPTKGANVKKAYTKGLAKMYVCWVAKLAGYIMCNHQLYSVGYVILHHHQKYGAILCNYV